VEYIKRNYPAEFRAAEQSGLIEGLPIVFDTPTDIGGMFQETICKGAISKDVLKDVRFFWNHNIDEKAIARSIIPIEKLGGMELTVTDEGVNMVMNPNRKRTDANDLCLAIEDGVINAMSFMFGVSDERWEDLDTEYPKRFITRIDPVIEVSAVNFPAYASTDIHARRDTATDIDRAALEKMRTEGKPKAETEARAITNKFYYYYGGK
jgi:HK97 family phage prohead protease